MECDNWNDVIINMSTRYRWVNKNVTVLLFTGDYKYVKKEYYWYIHHSQVIIRVNSVLLKLGNYRGQPYVIKAR